MESPTPTKSYDCLASDPRRNDRRSVREIDRLIVAYIAEGKIIQFAKFCKKHRSVLGCGGKSATVVELEALKRSQNRLAYLTNRKREKLLETMLLAYRQNEVLQALGSVGKDEDSSFLWSPAGPAASFVSPKTAQVSMISPSSSRLSSTRKKISFDETDLPSPPNEAVNENKKYSTNDFQVATPTLSSVLSSPVFTPSLNPIITMPEKKISEYEAKLSDL